MRYLDLGSPGPNFRFHLSSIACWWSTRPRSPRSEATLPSRRGSRRLSFLMSILSNGPKVTRIFNGHTINCLDFFSIFGHLQQWKLAQSCHTFAKVCSAFCQIRNILSKIWPFTYKLLPKWRNLDKSGHSVSITQCLNLLSMPRPEALDWLGRLLFSRS